MWRQNGTEFAGREGFEGAEAGGEFGGGQSPFAIEVTEVIYGRSVALKRIAFDAGGDEIAVGVGTPSHARNDVIETARTIV